MKNILIVLLLLCVSLFGAQFTSSGNGSALASATWGDAGVPGTGDTATITHTVTVDATWSVGYVLVNGGTLVVDTDDTLNLSTGLEYENSATVTLNSGSHIIGKSPGVFIRHDGVGNLFQSNGAGRSVVRGENATNYVRIYNNDGSSGSNYAFHKTDFMYLGTSSVKGFSIYGDYDVGTFSWEFDSCKFQYCGEIYQAGYPNAATTLDMYRCYFIDGLATNLVNIYHQGQNINANARQFRECVFVENDTTTYTTLRVRSNVNTLSNPYILTGVVKNVLLDLGAYITASPLSFHNMNMSSLSTTLLQHNSNVQAVTYKNFVAHSQFLQTDFYNAHVIGGNGFNCVVDSGIIDIDKPDTSIVYEPNAIYGSCGNGGVVNVSNTIVIGGNGLITQNTNDGTFTITNCTQICPSDRTGAGRLYMNETQKWIGDAYIKNCLFYTQNDDMFATGNLADVAELEYSDFNAISGQTYDSASLYTNIIVRSKVWGDSGWDGNSFALGDPGFKGLYKDVASFDSVYGGSGVAMDACAEFCKLGGLDTSGAEAVHDTNYTLAKLLVYLREAYTPTNDSLLTAGEGDTFIGALEPDTTTPSIRKKVGVMGTILRVNKTRSNIRSGIRLIDNVEISHEQL